jgi:hypothetical protein
MPQAVRKLTPGQVVIGFMTLDGQLIGELVQPEVGHDELSLRALGLRAKLASGHAVGITIGKSPEGEIRVFGSGYFPPPGGARLGEALQNAARRLVE